MEMINKVHAKDGTPYGFWTNIISFGRLCRCITRCPGVTFTHRPRFVWWGDQVRAEFTYKGRDFTIEQIWADWHVGPKDEKAAYPEISGIWDHVERNAFSPLMQKIVSVLHTDLRRKKGNANQASHATSEPAPGAASSSREG